MPLTTEKNNTISIQKKQANLFAIKIAVLSILLFIFLLLLLFMFLSFFVLYRIVSQRILIIDFSLLFLVILCIISIIITYRNYKIKNITTSNHNNEK